jgi:hypothetical protein
MQQMKKASINKDDFYINESSKYHVNLLFLAPSFPLIIFYIGKCANRQRQANLDAPFIPYLFICRSVAAQSKIIIQAAGRQTEASKLNQSTGNISIYPQVYLPTIKINKA